MPPWCLLQLSKPHMPFLRRDINGTAVDGMYLGNGNADALYILEPFKPRIARVSVLSGPDRHVKDCLHEIIAIPKALDQVTVIILAIEYPRESVRR